MNETKSKITDKVLIIPNDRQSMVNAFLFEQERENKEQMELQLEHSILNEEIRAFEGKIAEKRKKLYEREKENLQKRSENLDYARSINKLYPGTIVFQNGASGGGEEYYQKKEK